MEISMHKIKLYLYSSSNKSVSYIYFIVSEHTQTMRAITIEASVKSRRLNVREGAAHFALLNQRYACIIYA